MRERTPETETARRRAAALDVEIVSLATAVPSHRYTQDEALTHAKRMFPEFGHLDSVFANTGIESRYSCVPLDWFQQPHDWVDRNAVYERAALDLLEQAARGTMARAGAEARDIAALVTVSTTGLSVPSLDAKLMHRLGFVPETERLPVFGLGCAGGVSGMSRAARLAATMDGRGVLMLCVELCGLNLRASDRNKVNYVASALFGDGAAAVLLRAPGGRVRWGKGGIARIRAFGEHNWPDTGNMMGWSIERDGFGVVMSTQIPQFARGKLKAAVETFLTRHGLAISDLDGVVSHPGGRKVLEAVRDALQLEENTLFHGWDVLREYGNMSSPTVLFVLERALAAGARGRHLMAAFGPGFTVSFALLEFSPA